jgi:hypothetical protein
MLHVAYLCHGSLGFHGREMCPDRTALHPSENLGLNKERSVQKLFLLAGQLPVAKSDKADFIGHLWPMRADAPG